MRKSLLAAALCLLALPLFAQKFKMDCKPPFPSGVELSLGANDTCGIFGDAADAPDGPHALQNAAKNNLCVDGDPVLVTFATFHKLQAAIEKAGLTNFTATKLPKDRSVFENMVKTTNGETVGEKTLVSVVAYVKKVKPGGKESVNCKVTRGRDLLDYHIVLVNSPNDDECESITAEAIPHFRPTAWDAAKINAPDVPMRFTGQMFIDASHKPCENGKGKPGNPARFTSWEIHPVYAIDVCKFATKTKCKVDDESVWIPLDQWEESEEDE
jgi:hypothetical protein